MNNDLISRSALRKVVNDFYDNSFEGIVSSDLIKYAEAVDELIDKAPTVDTTFREVVAYECGQKSVEERPKGTWIGSNGINYIYIPILTLCVPYTNSIVINSIIFVQTAVQIWEVNDAEVHGNDA